MKKRFSLLFLLLGVALLGAGCLFSNDRQAIPQDFAVYYFTGGCYGTCPNYSVQIKADGTGTYEGKAYVKTTGTKPIAISERDLQKLSREIDRMNFFSLPDTLIGDVSGDAGRQIIEVTKNGRTKKITFDVGTEELDRLADAIDDALRIEKLIK